MDIGPNFFGSYFSSSTEVLFQMNLLVKQTFDETLYNHRNPENSIEKYHFAVIKQKLGQNSPSSTKYELNRYFSGKFLMTIFVKIIRRVLENKKNKRLTSKFLVLLKYNCYEIFPFSSFFIFQSKPFSIEHSDQTKAWNHHNHTGAQFIIKSNYVSRRGGFYNNH